MDRPDITGRPCAIYALGVLSHKVVVDVVVVVVVEHCVCFKSHHHVVCCCNESVCFAGDPERDNVSCTVELVVHRKDSGWK